MVIHFAYHGPSLLEFCPRFSGKTSTGLLDLPSSHSKQNRETTRQRLLGCSSLAYVFIVFCMRSVLLNWLCQGLRVDESIMGSDS
jgi:hypothetical protein